MKTKTTKRKTEAAFGGAPLLGQCLISCLVPSGMSLSRLESRKGAASVGVWYLGVDPAPPKKLIGISINPYHRLSYLRLDLAYKVFRILYPLTVWWRKVRFIAANLSKSKICRFVLIPQKAVNNWRYAHCPNAPSSPTTRERDGSVKETNQ